MQQQDPGKINFRKEKDEENDAIGIKDSRLEMGLKRYKQKQLGNNRTASESYLNKKHGKGKNEDLPEY